MAATRGLSLAWQKPSALGARCTIAAAAKAEPVVCRKLLRCNGLFIMDQLFNEDVVKNESNDLIALPLPLPLLVLVLVETFFHDQEDSIRP
jgi:hypothetical protein